MKLRNLDEWRFPLREDTERQRKMDDKQKEYWQRIIDRLRETGWDLKRQYRKDRDFRLLYYKFLILAQVNGVFEKAAKNGGIGKAEFKIRDAADKIWPDLHDLFDLRMFLIASKVIRDYLTGRRPL